MGRITNKLSSFGSKIKKAITSKAAKNFANALGRTVEKTVNSDLGQKAIQGVVTGLATSALTGSESGEEVKRAVILNVLGVHDAVPDPNSPAEHALLDRVRRVEDLEKEQKLALKYTNEIEKKLTETEKATLKNVKDYFEKVEKNQNLERHEINVLEDAVKGYGSVMKLYEKDLQGVKSALLREDRNRTNDERKIIKSLERNYEAMRKTIDMERDALKEEATQQIIDIGGEMAEHMLEEVPFVGSAMAAGAASVRGAVQIYKLNKAIKTLTHLPVDHIEPPHVSPHVLKDIVEGTKETNEQLALRNINFKLHHLDDTKRELEHIETDVIPKIKEVDMEMRKSHAVEKHMMHGETKLTFKPSLAESPGVHCYTSCWDSDYVVIFHVISPLHMRKAFLICFDLMTEIVHFEDVYAPNSYEITYSDDRAPRMYNVVIKSFLEESAKAARGMGLHSERLLRGVKDMPVYINSMKTRVPYEQKRNHAMLMATDQNVQRHLLRGPLAFQRRALLNCLLHGIAMA